MWACANETVTIQNKLVNFYKFHIPKSTSVLETVLRKSVIWKSISFFQGLVNLPLSKYMAPYVEYVVICVINNIFFAKNGYNCL